MNKKIISVVKLSKKLKEIKKKRKIIIGLSHGVFDLVHLGHISHFNEAKNKADILIVSVTSDKYVFKGPGRPFFSQEQRMEVISNLESVDYVVLSDSESSLDIINNLKPNIYFKGPDYRDNSKDFTKKIIQENNLVKKNNGSTFYTSAKKFSSSELLKKYDKREENYNKILKKIKSKFNFLDIKKIIDNFNNMNPLVIGETIIDEYIFCEALGKSGKEPMLVIRDLYEEKYLGGAGAICNHLSGFTKKVNFLTVLGEKKQFYAFIKNAINKNVSLDYVKKNNSPTIIKKRFIDHILKSKILGVYSLNDDFVNKLEEAQLVKKFLKKKKDLVILSDYGHGMFTKKFINIIKSKSKFLGANVQINAANLGYHSLKNYENVDFIIINEKELRHEMRSKSEKIINLMKILAKNLKLKYLVVTRGSSGSILYNCKKKLFHYSPAYADKVIDKVGAGDTMLAILTTCLSKKIDPDLSLLIASFCAAQSVKILGNKKSIDKNILLKDLEHYLI